MTSTQGTPPSSYPANTLSMDMAFLRQPTLEFPGTQVVRLSGSSAQLWVASVLAVASILLFTLTFA